MTMARSSLHPLGILLAVAIALTACAGPGGGGVRSGRDVVVRLNSDWDSLDPAKTRTTYGYQLVTALYDRLVTVADGKVVPYLAESWTQTPDTVRLTLRPGARCASGTELTPTMVAASLRRLGAKETAAPYASLVFGGSGYTVTADDAARTVTVRTGRPYSDLLVGLAQPMASIVCPEGLRATDTLAATPAGSGPYTLAASTRGASYRLTARPGYAWGPEREGSYPDAVTFKVVQNDSTAANMLAAGDLDVSWVGGPDLARVRANPAVKPVSQLIYGSFMLVFNQAKGRPGADPAVRRALAGAVSAQSFNEAAFFGEGEPAGSVVSEEVPCHRVVRPPAAAGATVDVDLKLVGSTDYAAGYEYVLEALRKAGASVRLQLVELNSFAEVMFTSGDWDVTVYPFTPLAPSLGALGMFVTGAAPPDGANFASIGNKAFEASVAKAQASLGEERCRHWGDAQQAIVENADVVPLVHAKPYWFVRDGFAAGLAGGGTMVDPHELARR